MRNAFLRHFRFLLIVLVSYTLNAHAASESTYESVQWNKRGNDTFYCFDITDENLKPHPWLAPVICGDNLFRFSPREHLEKMVRDKATMSLPGVGKVFGWKVWSNSGYGGAGYEGIITVPKNCVDDGISYTSTSELIQWACRGDDGYYTIDILKEDGVTMVKQDAVCQSGKGNCALGLHKFDPRTLGLSPGRYKWKVWSSPSGMWGGKDFEGDFQMSSEGKILFSTHCSECHKDPKDSKIVVGSDPARIRNAIATIQKMNKLNSLDSDILQKIANYIKNPD